MKMAHSCPRLHQHGIDRGSGRARVSKHLRAGLANEHGVRRPCPAGHYGSDRGFRARTCNGNVPRACGVLNEVDSCITYAQRQLLRIWRAVTTEEGDGPCEPGYYCPRGSSSSTQRPCCDARRDDFTGLWYTFNGRVSGRRMMSM